MQAIGLALSFLKDIWWILAPFILFLIFRSTWLVYVQSAYLSAISWILLEIKIPKEVGKPPQAMEQIFAGFHGIKSRIDIIDKYWIGKVQLWFSCEMVGRGGTISFFIWTPAQFRNLVEAQVYAQYPESEIREVPDYTSAMPLDIPNSDTDLFGIELALAKDDGYPIRSYKEFAIEDIEEETQKVDPLSALAEVLSGLKEGEEIWIQYLVRPAGDEWKDAGQRIIDKLIGRKAKKKKSLLEEIMSELGEYLGHFKQAIFGSSALEERYEKSDDNGDKTNWTNLTQGEKDIVNAIENNIAKLGFDTAIRILYIAKRDIFQQSTIAALNGVYKQFNTQNMNGFKRVNLTGGAYIFKKTRELQMKRNIQLRYRMRQKPDLWMYKFTPYDFLLSPLQKNEHAIFTLNIEELATIYHFPGGVVTTLSMPRVEAKKGGPPVNLPFA